MADKKQMPVPPEGSLGLLAYGAQGIRAWRKARATARQDHTTTEGKGDD